MLFSNASTQCGKAKTSEFFNLMRAGILRKSCAHAAANYKGTVITSSRQYSTPASLLDTACAAGPHASQNTEDETPTSDNIKAACDFVTVE